jgi:hypothetical protein
VKIVADDTAASEEIIMSWESFWEHGAAIAFVVFVFGGSTIAGIVYKLSREWRKVRESEHLTALKQSLVERGMSADEIERVLNAGIKTAEQDS